jgi:hypothetical protein
MSDYVGDGSGQVLVPDHLAGDDLAAPVQWRSDAFPIAHVLAWPTGC